jgi:anti-sigma B factor antagonist
MSEDSTAGMKFEDRGDTLRVAAVKELGAADANAFRDRVRQGLAKHHKNVDIDLAQTTFVDSCGLGALVALHKTVCGRQGKLRLLNPQPAVQQILDLTRMSRIFEVVKT